MNWLDSNKHTVELLTDDYYTIGAQFYGTNNVYTYKVDKSVSVKVGDAVVVKAKGRFAVAEVVRVDERNAIDFTATYTYTYIVQVVDATKYDELIARSERIKTVLVELQRRNMKQQLLKELVGQINEADLLKLETDFGIKV